ncbi:MAG: hypothetical protein ACFC1C_01955 [Candidatus Malihini olakiniferum]
MRHLSCASHFPTANSGREGILVSDWHAKATWQEAKVRISASVLFATHQFNDILYIALREPDGSSFTTQQYLLRNHRRRHARRIGPISATVNALKVTNWYWSSMLQPQPAQISIGSLFCF